MKKKSKIFKFTCDDKQIRMIIKIRRQLTDELLALFNAASIEDAVKRKTYTVLLKRIKLIEKLLALY